jgi:hypothetical protein
LGDLERAESSRILRCAAGCCRERPTAARNSHAHQAVLNRRQSDRRRHGRHECSFC